MSIQQRTTHFQPPLARSASIHDTPPPESPPDPIAFESALFKDLDDLKSKEPTSEPREYAKALSIHDTEKPSEYGYCAPFQPEPTPEKSQTQKQSKRTKRKLSRKLKKLRKNQSVNTRHAFLTHEWFDKKNPFPLTLADNMFRMMFWTTNYNACPHRVLAKEFKMSKASIRVYDALLVEGGFMKIKTQYLEYKRKDGTVVKTKKLIHCYRKLTPKGIKLRQAIVEKARFGTPIPKELRMDIAIIQNNEGHRIPKKKSLLKPSEKKQIIKNKTIKSQKSVKENLGSTSSSSKEEHICQGKPEACDPSPEKENKKIFEEKGYHNHLETQFQEFLAKQLDIDDGRKKIFNVFGYEKIANTFAPWLKKAVNEMTITKLTETLGWISRKKSKGYKIKKSFASLFVWRMKQEKNPTPWLSKRTEEYMEAITKRSLMGGVDSNGIIKGIIQLQDKTGQKITERELHGLLCLHGAQYLKVAIDFVVFRSKRFELKDWVAYTHFTARKPIFKILKMYKSMDRKSAFA